MMNRSWDATDIAKLIYADYKSLSGKQKAEFLDRTPGAVYVMESKFRTPESLTPKNRRTLEKGQILEAQIRNGEAPDQRAFWDEQIGKIRGGIVYTYTEPETVEPEVEEVVEETVVEPVVVETPVVATPQNKPLFSLVVDVESIIAIIKAFKTI